MAGRETEIAVIGGGLVGAAVGLGLARRSKGVTIFDEGDLAFRASRGNFGLVWVQGKGVDMPDYARWSRLSAQLWPAFGESLTQATGIRIELTQKGGLQLFLSDGEAESAMARLSALKDRLNGDYPFEFLGHNALKERMPAIGPEVVGASYHPEDGHVNPLYLLRALHGAFADAGGRVANGAKVARIQPYKAGFDIAFGDERWRARQVVLCAGLDNARLAPMIGLDAPVRPNRGQVLITERLRGFLDLPTVQVRQTGEGTVQIGDSHEDVGLDDGTTGEELSRIASRALRLFPVLKHVRVVRCWGALRVMSPDGHPIYDRSPRWPGAFLVTCHSGVTLAAVHAEVLAGWILDEPAPDYMEVFSARRFPLQAA